MRTSISATFSFDKNVDVGTNPPPLIALITIDIELRMLTFPRRYTSVPRTAINCKNDANGYN